jgi:hypothetical protein
MELVVADIKSALPAVSKEYSTMLEHIAETMPSMTVSSKNFHKTNSQFMMITLDMTALTPLRSIYHTLAEVEQTKSAIESSIFKLRKEEIKIRQKKHDLVNIENSFDRELAELEIKEFEIGYETAQNYIKGAVRKLSFYTTQYKSIMETLGKEHITEEDYENEEYRHHIMTCMKQALCAARTRGGCIDEGNFIYLFELGINGAQAQAAVTNYLQLEQDMLKRGELPTHQMTLDFMQACVEQFQKDPEAFIKWRNLKLRDAKSLTDPTAMGA